MDDKNWDERYSGSDLVWSATPNRWVADFAAGLVPGRALDVAGGEGRNSLWLIESGWDATIVDFSEVALDRAVVASHVPGIIESHPPIDADHARAPFGQLPAQLLGDTLGTVPDQFARHFEAQKLLQQHSARQHGLPEKKIRTFFEVDRGICRK